MTNFLSNLPKIIKRKKKRLGRGLGSGSGSKSGRGTTRHQKAREAIPLHFEGGQARMVKKFPLLRGKGKNKPVGGGRIIISLSDLNQFAAGETVTMERLVEKKLIESQTAPEEIKVLANGKLAKKLTVRLSVSQQAKKAIEDQGGEVVKIKK